MNLGHALGSPLDPSLNPEAKLSRCVGRALGAVSEDVVLLCVGFPATMANVVVTDGLAVELDFSSSSSSLSF